jgi:three-Cys-motif partner protein
MTDIDDDLLLFDPGPRDTPAMPKSAKKRRGVTAVPSVDEQLLMPPAGQDSLIADDEGLLSRVIHMHSADKDHFAYYYGDIVGTGMRHKFPLAWVELFAGPGRLFNVDTERFEPGSPVRALDVRHPFGTYVFSDLDPLCVESLRRRVAGKPGVHVLQGDANDPALHDQVLQLVPRDRLVVLYLDPEGLELHFDTIRYFAARYPRLDLLLNLQVRGAIRYVRAGHSELAARMLGTSDPKSLVAGNRRDWGPSIREFFQRKLQGLGYEHFESQTIRSYSKNVEQYDLLLASRDPKAVEFFREAQRRGPNGLMTMDLFGA